MRRPCRFPCNHFNCHNSPESPWRCACGEGHYCESEVRELRRERDELRAVLDGIERATVAEARAILLNHEGDK